MTILAFIFMVYITGVVIIFWLITAAIGGKEGLFVGKLGLALVWPLLAFLTAIAIGK